MVCVLSSARSQTNTPITVKIDNNCGGYMEYLPAGYAASTTKKYPTIVYIHGLASFGNGSTASLLSMAKVEGVPLYTTNGQFPTSIVTPYGDTASFIAISPQFINNPTTPQDIKAVIDYVLAHYRVDTYRLYLTGYSLGGGAVWQAPFNLAQASRLAAMVPVAAYNLPFYDTTAKFIVGANVAVWAIHSSADQTAPDYTDINFVNKIDSLNPKTPAILTLVPGLSHDTTVTVVYNPNFRPNGKNIYEWMLQYAKFYPPTAVVGKDTSIVLPANSITLSGSGSTDPQHETLSYQWTEISGPAQYSLSSPTAANPVVSGLLAGKYSFALTITDSAGLTSTATQHIFVINPNAAVPPVANAGRDTTVLLPQTGATLNGSASYAPNGAIESYSWTQLQGPTQALIASPSAAVTTVAGLRPGIYQFQLAVTDNLDSTSKSTVHIQVINPFPNVPPHARAGADQTISLPVDSVILNGSASSDTDGMIISYHWRQLSGPSQSTIANANLASTTADNLVAGIYQFELTVQDDSSATGKDTVAVYANPLPKLVQVNVYGGSTPAGTGWNNWNVQSSLSSTAFTYSDGSTSVIKAVLSASTAVADNGASYPVTMCPIAVGRTASYYYTPRTLVISGLDSNNHYTFTGYATRAAGQPNTYAIGSSSVTVVVNNNYSTPVVFSNLSPSSGKITVNISGSYNYINGFTLTELGSARSGTMNKVPVAVAGANQSIDLPVDQVTVNGSGSYDPDGTVAAYSWQQLSGPAPATIASPSSVSTLIGGLDSGTYVFQLTVTDNSGAMATGTLTVTVGTAGYNNLPPVANAGPDITIDLPLDSTQLDGSASHDPDGSIVKYSWTKIAGPAVYSISGATTAKPAVTDLYAGKYLFALTVTDNYGATASDTVALTVTANPPVAPVANAGADANISFPVDSATLDGSASYCRDTTIVSYSWRQVAGPSPATINDSTLVKPQVSQLTGGTYTFELDVTDAYGLTGTDSVNVTVKPDLPPVSVPGNNVTLTLPVSSVQLNGNKSSDPDGSIAAYRWSELSGPAPYSINDSTVVNPVIGNLVAGVYVVSLTVTDNLGVTGSNTMSITVDPPLNIPPVANAGPDQTIVLPANTTILDGSASKDADGYIVAYAWRQLSGPSTSTLDRPDSVTTDAGNLVAGTYSFELAVTDDSLATSRDTMLVTVGTGTRQVQVNVYGGSNPAGTGWNNWNVTASLSSGSLLYSDGSSSTIAAKLSENTAVADNGASYPVTMCPVAVGRSAAYSWDQRTLTISGLSSTKVYNVEFYDTRTNGNQNTYTIGTTSVIVNPNNNYSNKVVFNKLTTSTGSIVVTLFGSYNYINGFILTENAATGTTAAGAGLVSSSGAALLSTTDTASVVAVFPNPFKDQLQVRLDNALTGQVRMALIDGSGRALREFEYTKGTNTLLESLNLPDLPVGVYFIRVQMENWERTIRIVKQR